MMKYQVIYGTTLPLSAWFDTLEEALTFAERQPRIQAASVWERSEDDGAMVWPTTNVAEYLSRRIAVPPRRGPVTLQAAIEQAGTSQSQLARDSGVPLRTIQRILSGEIRLPNATAKNAMRLAQALSVDLRDLLAGESARMDK